MKHLKSEDRQQQNIQQQQEQNSPFTLPNRMNDLMSGEKEIVMGQTMDALENYNSNQLLQINAQQPLNHYMTNTQYTQPPSSNQISTQNSRRDQRGIQERFSKQGGVSQGDGGEEEILSVEEIIAKELSSPQFYHRLDTQIKQYASQFDVQQQSFQSFMKKQFDDREEYFQIQYNKCFEMIEIEQNKVNGIKQSMSNTMDAQNESLNTIQQCLQLIQQANLIFESNFFHLNQFCTILTHLTLQDEKDKNSIGLYGFRESPIDTNSSPIHANNQNDTLKSNQSPQRGYMNNVHLDEKCISCSGQSIQINSLFKLACLAYKPQPIPLEGKQYSRIDLLQLCQKILTNISLNSPNKKSPQKIHKKILRSSMRLEDDKDQNKQSLINESQMQETSRSFHEPSTHRAATTNTLNQTIDLGFSTHRGSILNQSNQNLDQEIQLLNNTYTAREQNNNNTNYYEVSETNPRQQQKSREMMSRSTKDWSISQEDKLKRFPSMDSGQIQLNDLNITQLSTSQMKIIAKHKVRKLVSNKNQKNQQSNDSQLNKTSINFNSNQQNLNKQDKSSSFEKRRQFIMKQNVISLNNSIVFN